MLRQVNKIEKKIVYLTIPHFVLYLGIPLFFAYVKIRMVAFRIVPFKVIIAFHTYTVVSVAIAT